MYLAAQKNINDMLLKINANIDIDLLPKMESVSDVIDSITDLTEVLIKCNQINKENK